MLKQLQHCDVDYLMIAHDTTEQSRGRVVACVCLPVFPHNISKTAAARITKLDTEMFHQCMSPGNPFILWSKTESSYRVDICTLVIECRLLLVVGSKSLYCVRQ